MTKQILKFGQRCNLSGCSPQNQHQPDRFAHSQLLNFAISPPNPQPSKHPPLHSPIHPSIHSSPHSYFDTMLLPSPFDYAQDDKEDKTLRLDALAVGPLATSRLLNFTPFTSSHILTSHFSLFAKQISLKSLRNRFFCILVNAI